MIFAAGLGTRLYPITKDKPKALAELNGISLLEIAIQKLIETGVSKIVVNTHHFAEKVEDFLKSKNFFDAEIIISFEKDLLETAGGLAFAKNYFNVDEEILLYNADIVSNIDLKKFRNHHLENNKIASLAVRNRPSDRVLLFENQILHGWRNKKTNEQILARQITNAEEYAFSGIHIVSYDIFEFLTLEKKSLTPFYLDLAKSMDIIAFDHTQDYWFDCGKPETLAQAEAFLEK